MEQSLILETSFLIDFERERRRGAGPAFAFLERHRDDKLYITHTVTGELAAGLSLSEKKAWEAFVKPFQVLAWTADVDWAYGQTYRYLQTNGLLIGSNDIWIAATALAYECPLVSANVAHFQRIPNLEVVAYR
jgi:predicted nucleic acid-binding protein